jgi:WD40 repeat protein
MTGKKTLSLLAAGSLALALVAALSLRPRPGTGAPRPRVLEGHRFPVRAVAFDRDGTSLTTVAAHLNAPQADTEWIVWDVATGRPRTICAGLPPDLTALALFGSGTGLATGAGHGAVQVWDAAAAPAGRWRGERRSGESAVYALAVSADGGRVASADRENTLTLWGAAGDRLWTRPSGHDRFALALAFAPDGRALASGGTDRTVRLWDVAAGETRAAFAGHGTAVTALAFAPDGRALATGDRDGAVQLWDVAAAAGRAVGPDGGRNGLGPDDEVTALAFTPDGRVLAEAAGRTVRLWDVPTAGLLARLAGHEGKVQCLAFSPDGTQLASGSHDRTVRLWEVRQLTAPAHR